MAVEGEARAVHENGCFGLLVKGGCWVDEARVVLDDWAPGGDREVVVLGIWC